MNDINTRAKMYYPELDFARGIAIVLVVLAHCIQCGNGMEYYSKLLFFDNTLYKVVYSFHMPLLMLISGFLLAQTIDDRSLKQIMANRIKSILIPIAMWNLVILSRHIISIGITGWLLEYIKEVITSFWFLWAVFLTTAGVTVIYKYGKNRWYWYALAFLITLFTPDMWNSECYKFMFPCFLIGFLSSKLSVEMLVRKWRKYILPIIVIIWLLFLLLYNYDTYIYTSGWTLLHKETPLKMFFIDMYRVWIGVLGSAVILWIAFKIGSKYRESSAYRVFINLGKSSMGIYIISSYINIVLQKVTSGRDYNIGITLLETVVVLTVTYYVTRILQLNKWTTKLFLGGRKI